MPKDAFSYPNFFNQFIQEVFGGFSFLTGVLFWVDFFMNGDASGLGFWAGLLFLAAGKIALPSAQKIWKTKLNLVIPGWVRIIVFIACWALAYYLMYTTPQYVLG